MEMKLRAILTAGLVRGTCGYQAGGLDTLESCWLFPKPGATVQAALQNCFPWLQASLDPPPHPPQCSFPSLPWWSELVAKASARGCKSKWSGQPHPALGAGSQWSLSPSLGVPLDPVGASPSQLLRLMAFQLWWKYVCMRNHVPSRVMSSTRHRITPAGEGEETAESSSCSSGQAQDHPSGFLGFVCSVCPKVTQAQGDSQCLHGVERQLLIPHPPNGF